MTLIVVLIVLTVLTVLTVKTVRGGKRIRLYEWNDRQSYVRLTPNPGFVIGGRHWCRAKKGRGH